MKKENEMTLEVVYDGKSRVLKEDEVKKLAEKGLDYDRMAEKYSQAVAELEKLAVYKDKVCELAAVSEVTPEHLLEVMEKCFSESKMNRYGDGEEIPEKYARKMLEMDHEIRQLKKEKEELIPLKKKADDTDAFRKEYPGIDINDIDKEIIEEWNNSDKSLVDIYNRVMLKKLMLNESAKNANEKNKNASTGRVSGISAPEKYFTDDEVRKMSDEEFSKNFRRILMQKKKEKEMNANG